MKSVVGPWRRINAWSCLLHFENGPNLGDGIDPRRKSCPAANASGFGGSTDTRQTGPRGPKLTKADIRAAAEGVSMPPSRPLRCHVRYHVADADGVLSDLTSADNVHGFAPICAAACISS